MGHAGGTPSERYCPILICYTGVRAEFVDALRFVHA